MAFFQGGSKHCSAEKLLLAHITGFALVLLVASTAVAATHLLLLLLPQRLAPLMQRDVPGMTRAAVPVLAAAGVKALSSGVNGFSAPPGVPKV